MKENILKGPIGGSYMTNGDGHKLAGDPEDVFGSMENARKHGFQQYDLISEGDSPSYLYLIDNGLRSAEDFSYGGWSGRLSPSKVVKNLWEDNAASADYNPETRRKDIFYSQTRWLEDIQNDFAARVDWTMKDYKEANHAPELSIKEGLDHKVKAGGKLTFHAETRDPDNNTVNCRWYIYEEAGTYGGTVPIKADGSKARLTVPDNIHPGETMHLICEAEDNGKIPLKRYARIILMAEPVTQK